MKKMISTLSALAIAAGAAAQAIPVFADDSIKVLIDGAKIDFDVTPIIVDERTLVPLRAIFEALGAEVDWEQETRTASAVRGNDTVNITIDSNKLYKNGNEVELDVPAMIVDERTLVPVRAISESFDCKVDWDGDTQTVIITTTEKAPEVTPTAAPETATEPIATAESEIIQSMLLSQEDMDTLTGQTQAVRYQFEQVKLPAYVLKSETLYEDMNDVKGFAYIIYEQWNKNGNSYILHLQLSEDSNTTYTIPGDATKESLEATFKSIMTDAKIDADTMFTGVTTYEYNDGELHIGIVVFNDASTIVDCKYIGIITDKSGNTRYFTAENDVLDPENWYVCEVTAEAHGTIGAMPKMDDIADEIEVFLDGIIKCYKNDISYSASLVRPLFPQDDTNL